MGKRAIFLVAILRRICKHRDGNARNQRATIGTHEIDGSLPILGSGIEFGQALLNILANATEPSRRTVHARAVRENVYARNTIPDYGEGMGDEESLAPPS